MRALLRTYPTKLEADLVSDQLREIGVATCAIQTADPAPYHPNAMAGLWIEDQRQLEDEETRAEVEAILTQQPITAEDEALIVQLDAEEAPEIERTTIMTLQLAFAIFVVLLASAAYIILTREPS